MQSDGEHEAMEVDQCVPDSGSPVYATSAHESSLFTGSQREYPSMATGGGSSGGTGGSMSADQFEKLLMEAFQRFKEDFKEEVRQGQEEAVARALKRALTDEHYTFKKKSNEEQATFNSEVQEPLREVKTALESAGKAPVIDRAKEALEKSLQLLADRQKLIITADRSECVVAEYTAYDPRPRPFSQQPPASAVTVVTTVPRRLPLSPPGRE